MNSKLGGLELSDGVVALHHPHGSFEKCRQMQHNSRKQHDLLNNKVENNTIAKLLTYKIDPTT
jgi:hypothetical protein